MKAIIPALFTLLFLSSCTRIPELEHKNNPPIREQMSWEKSIPAVNNKNDNEAAMNVTHEIKGNRLFIECYVPERQFFTDKNKILLSIDGKKRMEFETAAFIIKDIPKGDHLISLRLSAHNNIRWQRTFSFKVTIE